jgi:hypothetical protein
MIDFPASGLVFYPLKFSRNKLVHRIEPADPGLTDRDGLKYFLEIQVPEYPMAPTLVSLPRAEGRETPASEVGGAVTLEGAEFTYNQRNGKLDGQLTYAKPMAGQTTGSVVVTQTMPFRLRELVQGGTPPVNTDLTNPMQWVVKAGLSNEDFVAFGETFWHQHQAERRRFLTWQPDGKTVGWQQEEYLHFLVNFTPSPQQVLLRVVFYHRDGSVTPAQTKATLNAVGLNQVVCFPVGPAVLGAPDTALRYEVWLSNEQNRRFTETRTYWLDQAYQQQERAILFVNSLGGWDTLRLVGRATETLKVTQTVAERDRPADAPLDWPSTLVVSTEGEREIQVATGYFRRDAKEWRRYLDELLLSEQMYLVTDKGHVPLRRVTNALVDARDEPGLVSETLTFVRDLTVQNYSDLPPTEPTPTRPTAWQGVSYQHVLDAWGKRVGLLRAARLRKIYADDGTPFKPLTYKPNAQGDPDYEFPRPAPNVVPGSTPYPSALLERTGSFNRSNCPAGSEGGPATIVIAAGRYGGEAPGDADALAAAEAASLDTQAYADQWGTCLVNEHYTWSVPANHWHYRANRPARIGLYNPSSQWGNLQSLPAGSYAFPPGANDLDFPISDALFYFYVYGTPGAQVKVDVFRNGTLRKSVTYTVSSEGFDNHFLFDNQGSGEPFALYNPASGDRFFFKITDL